MLDQGSTILHQRSAGRAEVVLSLRGGAVRLDRLFQEGAGKAMLPRVDAAEPEVVFLNTAGGLTGGDVLGYRLGVGPGASAVATTQAAERVYDCAGGTARVSVEVEVGAGGRIDWLPQETILYDGAALERRTRVDLAGDAACLALEVLVFGRRAMGETVRRLSLLDRREVRRDGRPVLVEPLRLGAEHWATGRRSCAGRGRWRRWRWWRRGRRTRRRRSRASPSRVSRRGPAAGTGGPPCAHSPRTRCRCGAISSPCSGGCAAARRRASGRLEERTMNLTPREKDKLLVSVAAMVARGRLARGVRLNHPEAIALITDFVVEGARDGRSVADLMEAGAHVVTAEQCMEGIPDMIRDVQIEATFPDGTKLVTVNRPIR